MASESLYERIKALAAAYKDVQDDIDIPEEWRDLAQGLAEGMEGSDATLAMGFALTLGMIYVRDHGLPEWIMQIPGSPLAIWTPQTDVAE